MADVLLTGLQSDDAALARLAAAHPARGREREERLVLAVRARRAREMAAAVPHVRSAAAGARAADRAAVLVEQLERGTIGDAPAVERVLRDDVLGAEHPAAGLLDQDLLAEAADVLADAVIGYFAADVLPPLVRRQLTGLLRRLADDAPVAGPETPTWAPPGSSWPPSSPGSATRTTPAGPAGAAVDEGRAERRPWATAMHEASWAAHVSGRTRVLAAAQLLAVQAFLDGGFDGRDGAAGAWNAVAGFVQGITMGDLLDESALTVLRAPLTRSA